MQVILPVDGATYILEKGYDIRKIQELLGHAKLQTSIIYTPVADKNRLGVIQAKRYTNVVGVAAVRDLYGTVMNEGATKGILVTTSDYGKDSYEFAKDKPITLLNGSNLLSLLEKHGHKARINIAEAKKIMKV